MFINVKGNIFHIWLKSEAHYKLTGGRRENVEENPSPSHLLYSPS
jgi:hypothetical protein